MNENKHMPTESLMSDPDAKAFSKLSEKLKVFPAITQLIGESTVDALVVCIIANPDNEDVWDDIGDAEMAWSNNLDRVVIFRECDTRFVSVDEFKAELPKSIAERLV